MLVNKTSNIASLGQQSYPSALHKTNIVEKSLLHRRVISICICNLPKRIKVSQIFSLFKILAWWCKPGWFQGFSN